MKYKTSDEKVKIIFDIINKLKNFDNGNGPQDIFQSHHDYVKECKKYLSI